MTQVRHFLKETDLSVSEIAAIFGKARDLKQDRLAARTTLAGQSWALLFFKNSTRTRISFDVGLSELGAHSLFLDAARTQLGRGESPADTARVLSRYLHGIIIRCHDHAILEAFASSGSIPVVNALTDLLHPCQSLTDCFTLAEKLAPNATTGDALVLALKGRKLAFVGDAGSNMANSLMLAGAMLDMEVVVSGPDAFAPKQCFQKLMHAQGYADRVHFTTDVSKAVSGADALYTDVWVSMGDEADAEARRTAMQPYQVNPALMAKARAGAQFLHCLPAHPGEEVTQDVLDSPASVIFDQAENRLHVQKAILTVLGNA